MVKNEMILMGKYFDGKTFFNKLKSIFIINDLINNYIYYLNNFLPSLVAESAEFTRDAQNIIHHISTLHSFITKFSKDEISAPIITSIPYLLPITFALFAPANVS